MPTVTWQLHKARQASPLARAVAGIFCLSSVLVIILALNASRAYGIVWYEEDIGTNHNSCWLSGSVEEYGSEAERECDASGSSGFAANHMLNDTNAAKDYELSKSGDYCSYYGLGDSLTSPEEADWFSLHAESYNEKTGWWSETSMPPDNFQVGDGYNVCASYRIGEWYDSEGHRVGDLLPVESTWGLEFQNRVAGNTCSTGCGMQRYVSLAGQGLDDRPWASYFEEPKLTVSNEVEPRRSEPLSEHPTSWSYLCPVIEDSTTGNIIELCFEEWRGTTNGPEWEKERVAHCASPLGLGHNLDRVITLFYPGTKFATYSGEETQVISQKRMSFTGEVSRTNLENVVKADNEFCGRKSESSLNPVNWALIGIASGVESSEYHQIAEIDYRLFIANDGKEFPISISGENATEISGRAAAITGKVDPYGYDTSYIVEYGNTSEYGKNGSESIVGSGMKEIPISSRLSGLLPGTTYHYRIHAYRSYENGREPTYGPDQVFTTPPEAPTVVTGAASSVTKTSATLSATVTPEGATVTTCKFEYGPTETYGKSVTCASLPGSGDSPVEVSASLTGLSETTTYHYRIVATNSVGTTNGADGTFETYPYAPSVVAGTASSVTKASATLNAKVNPNDANVTTCKFEYGTTISYGKSVSCASLPGSGTSPVEVSASLTGLSETTTYHYRVVATNSVGTTNGADGTFETYPYAPSVVAGTASSVTKASATLNAKVNPNDANVTACTFEYGTTISYGKSASCTSLPGSGTSEVAVSAPLSGLSAQTLYHFRIVATNSAGTSWGYDRTFQTQWECLIHIAGSGESVQSVAQTSVWTPISEGCVSYNASGSGQAAWGVNVKNHKPSDHTGKVPSESGNTFIGSDEPLNEAQLKNLDEASGGEFGKAGKEQAVVIPVAQTAIAVIVNPPAECSISAITNANLKEVWSGAIVEWGQITGGASSGAGVTEKAAGACKKKITRVVRHEASGATEVFKTYLEEAAKGTAPCSGGKKWSEYAAPAENANWPECAGKLIHAAGSGGRGEVEEVVSEKEFTSKEGTIGYAGLSDARSQYTGANRYTWLSLQNQKENYTTFEYPGTSVGEPSKVPAEANCEETHYSGTKPAVGPDDNWSGFNGARTKENVHYPICTLTYDVGLENYETALYTNAVTEGVTTKRYLEYVTNPEGGQSTLPGHDCRRIEEAVGTFGEEEAKLVG